MLLRLFLAITLVTAWTAAGLSAAAAAGPPGKSAGKVGGPARNTGGVKGQPIQKHH